MHAPATLTTLTTLRKFAAEHPLLGELGLIVPADPDHGLQRWEYRSTPTNAWTFASTGGDGVHFSLVGIDGVVTDRSSVVMTVPMQFDSPNWIVGADLTEFLCLGLPWGWFGLEQMAYSSSWFANLEGREPLDAELQEVVVQLSSQLRLTPWDDVPARLADLAGLLDQLELPASDPERA